MKHTTKMTLRYLKQQKLRTFLTIICVALAMYLISIFGVYFGTAYNAAKGVLTASYGNWHFCVSGEGDVVTPQVVDRICNNAAVESSTFVHSSSITMFDSDDVSAYADGAEITNRRLYVDGNVALYKAGNPSIVSVQSISDIEGELQIGYQQFSLKDGEYPDAPGEVAFADGFDYKIGDKVTLGYADSVEDYYFISDEGIEALQERYDAYIIALEPSGRIEAQCNRALELIDMLSGIETMRLDEFHEACKGEYVNQDNGLTEEFDLWDDFSLGMNIRLSAVPRSNSIDCSAEYTIVGIADYGALIISDKDQSLTGLFDDAYVDLWFRLKPGSGFGTTFSKATSDVLASAGLKSSYDWEGITDDGSYGLYSGNATLILEFKGKEAIIAVASSILPIGIAIIAILLIARLIIDNAFTMSAKERTRQFGVLRLLGATKPQFFAMMRAEALFYIIVSLPIGLGAALLTGEIVTRKLRNLEYLSVFTVDGVTDLSPYIETRINIPVLLFFVLLCGFAVLISTYTSARFAAKVPPIESINYGNPKTKKKPRRFRSISGKLFCYRFSKRNLKRDKKSLIVVTISIFFGALLYMLSFTFLNSYVKWSSDRAMKELNATASVNLDDPMACIELLKEKDFVEAVHFSQSTTVALDFNNWESYINDDFRICAVNNNISAQIFPISRYDYEDYIAPYTSITYDDLLKNDGMVADNSTVYVKSNRFGDREDYHTTVFKDSAITEGDGVSPIYGKHSCGDDGAEISLMGAVNIPAEKRYYVQRVHSGCMVCLMPIEVYTENPILFCTNSDDYAFTYHYEIEVDNNKLDAAAAYFDNNSGTYETEFHDDISKGFYDGKYQISEGNLQTSSAMPLVMIRADLAFVRAVQIVVSSLVVVILMIALINVMNTINTNLLNRQRELYMLRAIGMSRKQLCAVVLIEASIQVVRSCVLAALATLLLMWTVSEELTVSYSSILLCCLICLLSVIAVAIPMLIRIERGKISSGLVQIN